MHFVVNTANDVLSDSDGKTSLREAIAQAAELGRPALITFDPTVFGVFAQSGGGFSFQTTVQLNARIVIPEGVELLIDGSLPGGQDVTLRAGGDRIFDIRPDAIITLKDLQLSGGRALSANGDWGQLQINQPGAGRAESSNDGADGPNGLDSGFSGAAAEVAVAGIVNAGTLTLERVAFNGFSATAGHGGRGGDGGGGGDGGTGKLISTQATGQMANVTPPNGFADDNYNPVVVAAEAHGSGGDGGDGGDGSNGGRGGNAVGAIMNTGALTMRDVSFVNISAQAGNGGTGGTGGAGGRGGESSAMIDPGWVINVSGTGARLRNVEPTIENYANFPYSAEVLPADVIRTGVVRVETNTYGYSLGFIPGLAVKHGDGGDSGNGGNGGNGGTAYGAVWNLGSVVVEGAQGDIANSVLTQGRGGFAGASLIPGSAGTWFRIGPFDRDLEFEWTSTGRPFLWTDAWFDPYGQGTVGTRGSDGVDGVAGSAIEFGGLGVTTAASTVFVEPMNRALIEGEAPAFVFTRTGDSSTSASVAYSITLGPGLTADDFATPPTLSGTVIFGARQLTQVLRLPELLVDGIDEATERLTLTLDGSSAALGYSTSAQVLVGDVGQRPNVQVGTDAGETLFARSDVEGRGGNDRIFGSNEADRLDGGEGDDFIRGNGGDDYLIGGAGADTFSFVDAWGRDVVEDFGPGEDRIEIDVAFADLIIEQVGADTEIRPDGDTTGRSIVLLGVDAGQLTASQFTQVTLPPLPTPEPVSDLAARPDSFFTLDAPITGNLFADNGAGADTASSGGTLRIVAVTVGGVDVPLGAATALASGAVLTVNADGSFSYDPSGAFGGAAGLETIGYTIADRDAAVRPPSFEAIVDSSGFAAGDGSLGLVLQGAGANDGLGGSIAYVGDVNGDGRDDLLVAVDGRFGGSQPGDGRAYLIYGTADGLPLTGGSFDTGVLDFGDGSLGVTFGGIGGLDHQVVRVAAGGDFNNDGRPDLVISAYLRDSNLYRTYVVHGRDDFDGFVNLSAIAAGDGSAGFAFDTGGQVVTSIGAGGDVNGDGIDDLVIGVPFNAGSGSAFVLFGSDGAGPAGVLQASAITTGDGTRGYELRGLQSGDGVGQDVAIIGDINDDGIDDLVVGAPGANISFTAQGRVFVLYGNDNRFGDADGLILIQRAVGDTGTQPIGQPSEAGIRGFSIDAVDSLSLLGFRIAHADINNDGIDDILAAEEGQDRVVVLFGSADGYPFSNGRITLSEIANGDGSRGMILQGSLVSSAGMAVEAGGDINGDGIADIIISGGAQLQSGYVQQTYVLYGSDTGFELDNGVFDLESLATGDGSAGFVLRGYGRSLYNQPDHAFGGDFDGDGASDLVIGAIDNTIDPTFKGLVTLLFGRGGSGAPAVPTASTEASITVGRVPVSDLLPALGYATAEDTPLSDTLGTGDFVLLAGAQSGTVALQPDGSFLYTPDENFNGTDGFIYSVDGRVGTVTLTVTAVADAPVPENDSAETSEGVAIEIDVLGNDIDIDGNGLDIIAVGAVSGGGTASIADGLVRFDPGTDFNYLAQGETAVASFNVTVGNGGASATSTVTVTVNGVGTAPTTVVDEASTVQGEALSVDVVANDLPADGQTPQLTGATLAPGGDTGNSVRVEAGQVVFTPTASFVGTAFVSYTVEAAGQQARGLLTIQVEAAPGAPELITVAPDIGENEVLRVGVQELASDPDDDALQLVAVEVQGAGSAVIEGDEIVYDPGTAFDILQAGQSAEVSIAYTVSDGTLVTAGAMVVTINGEDDAPEAIIADLGSVGEGAAAVRFDVRDSLVDVDTPVAEISIGSPSASWSGGALAVTLDGDEIVFNPSQLAALLDDGDEAEVTISFDTSDATSTTGNTLTLTVTGADAPSGPNPITGTPEADDIDGTAGADAIDALAGDDIVRPGLGADIITLGEGADQVIGTPAELFGDTITDFGLLDSLVFQGTVFGRPAMTRSGDEPTTIAFDLDGDSQSDGEIVLEGSFEAGEFMAVSLAGDTIVSYGLYLPQLSEMQAVAADRVNGILNPLYLVGDGSSVFQVQFSPESQARKNNGIGVYEITPDGTITDVRLLVANVNADKNATVLITDVEAGNQLGFFLVQGGAQRGRGYDTDDVFRFVDLTGNTANIDDGAAIRLLANGRAIKNTIFHSHDAAMNGDGVQHALSGVDPGGRSLTIGFEDLWGGGDQDYQDVVFRLTRGTMEEFSIW